MISFTEYADRTAYAAGDVVAYGQTFYMYGLSIPASNVSRPDTDPRAYELTFTSRNIDTAVTAAIAPAITEALSPPEIAAVEPLVMAQNEAYSLYLSSAGASVLARQWSVSDGMLPADMSLDEDTGELNGTPSEMQEATIATIQCVTVFGTRTRDISFEVQGTPVFGRISLPTMMATQAMTSYPIPIDAVPSATVIVVSGSLPAGVTLSSEGEWSGTPSAAGSGSVTIRATNSIGHADATISWTVVAATKPKPAPIVAPTLNDQTFDLYTGVAYSQQIELAGGSGSVTYSKVRGSFPSSISMSASGLISGTSDESVSLGTGAFGTTIPKEVHTVTVRATNSAGSDDATITFNVFPGRPHYANSTALGSSYKPFEVAQITTKTFDLDDITNGAPTITYALTSYQIGDGNVGDGNLSITIASDGTMTVNAGTHYASPNNIYHVTFTATNSVAAVSLSCDVKNTAN